MNIEAFILEHEKSIRMIFFFGILAIMAIWEILKPRRKLSVSKPLRWVNNIALVFLNTILLRLIFPLAAVGMTLFVQEQGWGLLNYYELPAVLEFIIAILVLDMVIYLQHVMVHALPVLWRLHRVHHADMDFDVTTGSRFHPLEILLSMLIKFATIVVLGPSILAVIVFEILLNMTSMFNHSNIYINPAIDKWLRLFVVTPDMHRVHHSIYDDETNSNFGFNLPWWDRLFATYKAQPRKGHTEMTIGIDKFRNPSETSWLPSMLIIPFKGRMSGYALNRRQWGDTDEEQ